MSQIFRVNKSDTVWNYFAFSIMGATGVLSSLIVATFYDSSTLGFFNQIFAIYIVASQIATLGVHYSVLTQVATAESEDDVRRQITSAFLTSVGMGALTMGLILIFRDSMAHLLESPNIAAGLLFIGPAVGLIAINKVLLNALNGLQYFKLFAWGQSTRYLLILSALLAMAVLQYPPESLAFIFLFAESCLALLLIFLHRDKLKWASGLVNESKDHFVFGLKGFSSGLLTELNSRIDVLMLGVFLDDAQVGIYSFAAFFAEGFYQLFVVGRNLVTPGLAKLMHENRLSDVRKLFWRFSPRIWASAVLGSLACLGALRICSVWISWMSTETDMMRVLSILLIGIIIVSPFILFDRIFIVAKRPEIQSLHLLLIASTNAILNYFLIQEWGLVGAAIATSASFLMGAFYLYGLSVLTLRTRIA